MSPVFDKSQLYRRWLHLPSIAVIALAGASVAIAHMGIDAWRARWLPKHEHEQVTTQVVGRAEIPHVHPDRIEWSVTADVSAKNEDEARRVLAVKSHQAIDKLLAAGVPRGEIYVDESVSVAPTSDSSDIYGGLGINRQGLAPQPYEATQAISIRSRNVGPSLAAYQTVALDPTPSLDVTAPTCWREDSGELRRQAQQAAWADVNRQAALLRSGHATLGRVVGVDASDAEVSTNYETSKCDEEQSARATVTVTYELR